MIINLLPSRPLSTFLLRSEPRFAVPGAQRRVAQAYESQITVGTPGRCPQKPVLCICLFDNSGSILGGNDPIGQRFVETYLALTRVGARCKCGRDLVAVLHFDTPTSGDLAPISITKPHLDGIRASLAVPPDGAGMSVLGPSLHAARQLATRYPTHRVVLAVHSDFLLFDNCLSDLAAFPGDAWAIVLTATPPPMLVEATNVSVVEVNHASPPGTVARAIFTALTATRLGAKPLPIPQ